ncbi:hypothetical protein LCGC14_1484670 [marine sediment metagenome]|uniref:Uncharacterized protein n=1 Tax=marine sediment metagenome TaxID=412755 RepID=A0A0F9J949_9ZZZZ
MFWKDKEGNKLTRQEFFERWKKGIQMVTPLQQIRIQIRSTKISLIGVVGGIGISIYKFEQLWWVLLILLGVLGVTSMQLLGMVQKRNILENIEKLNKEVDDNV